MAKFSRRHVLGGGSALLIGTGLDGKAHDADARVAGRGRLTADVCVVGAGYAGLAAALRLKQGGAKVIVLEARNRVGGRSLTAPLDVIETVWSELLPLLIVAYSPNCTEKTAPVPAMVPELFRMLGVAKVPAPLAVPITSGALTVPSTFTVTFDAAVLE